MGSISSGRRIGLVCAIVATLAACGGGGSAAPEPTTPAASAPCTPLAVVHVEFLGDSTQAGWDGGTGTYGVPASAAVQAYFDAKYPGRRVIVSNHGISGSTSADAPSPLSSADIVVVNWGINDMTRWGGAGASDYKARLRAMARPGIVFETPNIVKDRDVEPFAQAMREVAAEVHAPVADVYAYTAGRFDWQTLTPDWAHPSAALYGLIGRDVLVPALQPAVSKLFCEG